MHVFLQKICIYEKNVLPLHSLLRNKRVSLFSREAERRCKTSNQVEGIKI